jgi:hypothetical protein
MWGDLKVTQPLFTPSPCWSRLCGSSDRPQGTDPASMAKTRTAKTACGKTQIFVIPRRAARRGISLLLRLNQREIPHFVRNDKINYFFRNL